MRQSTTNTRPTVLKTPPFRVAEDGWGEFELKIDLQDAQGKTHEFLHDLNFQNPRYEVKHVITFKSPKPILLAALRESGPVPGDTNGAVDKKRASEVGVAGEKPKKKKGGESSKAFDMDKLAEGLQKLNEDDLLQVVQMVHDHKSDESWMRNDIERECNSKLQKRREREMLTIAQKENFTSISTRCPITSSRCSGTSPQRKSRCRLLLRRWHQSQYHPQFLPLDRNRLTGGTLFERRGVRTVAYGCSCGIARQSNRDSCHGSTSRSRLPSAAINEIMIISCGVYG